MTENLLKLYANLDSIEPSTELSAALGIPSPEHRQIDLQYITAVFVSSGFNLNSAYFLPTELAKSKGTIAEKPLDYEHEQDKIVGHLYSSVFAYKDRSLFDPDALYAKMGDGINSVSMDIIAAMRLYKTRFPELAQEILAGEYKVSMECYYKDYDVIVDNVIIPKTEAKALGLIGAINKVVRVVEGNKAKGDHRVGRVLRDMLFSGCGIVKNPANPDSIILETATTRNDNYILDLCKVDSYMKAKQEKESIIVNSLGGAGKEAAYLSASYGGSHSHEIQTDKDQTFWDGGHTHIVMPDQVPDGIRVYFIGDGQHRHPFNGNNGDVGPESEHTHKVYIETDSGGFRAVESSPAIKPHRHELTSVDLNEEYSSTMLTKGSDMGATSYGGVHYHIVTLEDGTELKTLTPMDVLKMDVYDSDTSHGMRAKSSDSTVEGAGFTDGHPLSKPEICVNFKRRVYEKGGDNPGLPANADKTPGLVPQVESFPAPTGGGAGNTITQQDSIVHENWCKLFEAPCTTPGGVAMHPECLRLVLNRATKDIVTDYFKKLEENRNSVGVTKALSSLKSALRKAKGE